MLCALEDYIGTTVKIRLTEDQKEILWHIDDILEVEFIDTVEHKNNVWGYGHIKSNLPRASGREHLGFDLFKGDIFKITKYVPSDDFDDGFEAVGMYVHIDNTDLKRW